ncbi:MAG: amphi-Trp domain-containing protein [Pseudonocardia sp.]|nr:amphi-Trp domain-containing protein [Pseudonocardia sp.]
MSDVEVSRTEALSRKDAARRLAALAAALDDGGRVKLELGATTLKLHVPDHVRCEVEVEVDGDEVELEVELKWSTARAEPSAPESSTHESSTHEPSTHEPAATKSTRRARNHG